MKIAKISAIAALLLGMIGFLPIRGVAAGTDPATSTPATIFVANSFNVNAYPADSDGDVVPIVPPTNMVDPGGFARDASGRIYVTNTTNGTITVYAANADGNVPPIAVITGPNTQLSSPTAIALDASGRIYVLTPVGGEESITVYPPLGTKTGVLNEAPVATIAGSKTLLDNPVALALDSHGSIYVANEAGGPIVPGKPYDQGMLTVYPALSNGNVAPVTTIGGAATGLATPEGIALDSDGNIYVFNIYTANVSRKNAVRPSITVYPRDSSGNVAPVATISGNKTHLGYSIGIALDSARNLYTTGYVNGTGDVINVYQAGSDGNVSPGASITGADTGLSNPDGLVFDSHGNLYVLNGDGGPDGSGSITIYPPGGVGNASPSATIVSNIARLDNASGIALNSIGTIYVANELGGAGGHGSVTIYPAGSYANVSPIATIEGDHTKLHAPLGISLDSNDNIAVLNSDRAITVYPANSTGDALPSATITIDRGGYNVPTGIAVGPRGKFYVVNQLEECPGAFCYKTGAGDVAVYPADSDGNSTPSTVIRGSDTKLAFPSAIAVDPSGDIYVANEGPKECALPCGCYPTGPGSVTVYAPGTNGDAKPAARISGENTGLGLPLGIALDSNGNIYVVQFPGTVGAIGCITGVASNEQTAAMGEVTNGVATADYNFVFGGISAPILIFAAGSNGNVAPIAAIGGSLTGLDFFSAGIAVGPAGP